MKTKILSLAVLSIWSISSVFAQDRTTVTATNQDISDNLDLRAVASIFGDSRDLEDFERRLNDPRAQISNLDLNGDNRVDYLRVIETVEGPTHIIVIQSVLGRDMFQDIATVEVERDRYNRVQVQVVGDVYMYGNNYIYEPVYVSTPVIYNTIYVTNYRPYWSSWYWGYYPGFYVAWEPYPIYTYHSHIGIYINFHNHYNYVDNRRCGVVYNNYYAGRRGNAYENQYPNRSFTRRNEGYSNRHELVNTRTSNTRSNAVNGNTRNNSGIANTPRPYRGTTKGSSEVVGNTNTRSTGVRGTQSTRSVTMENGREINDTPRNNGTVRSNNDSPRAEGNTRTAENPRNYGNNGNNGNTRAVESQRTYGNSETRGVTSQGNSRVYESQRTEPQRNIQRNESQGNSNQREYSQQRGNSQQRGGGEGNSRGGGSRRG